MMATLIVWTLTKSFARNEKGADVSDFLDPTSLVLIASPKLCSPTVRALDVGELMHAWTLSFTAVVWNSAPLPCLDGPHPCCSGGRHSCSHLVSATCVACAWTLG